MTTICIVGANRGIGREMVDQALAQGASVIATARKPDAVDWPAGVTALPLDVASDASQEAFAQAIAEREIDTLVCNAGVLTGHGALLDAGGEAEWRETLMTNVAGVLFTVRSALPALQKAKGKIAIISSQMGSSARAKGTAYAYRASKAATLNIGLNLATELRPHGIAVGIYHPGWVRTDMGTDAADISVEESASGLLARFDALSVNTTGCFENWDGRPHPL